MRLARWMDARGRVWVGRVDDGLLTPLARPRAGDPDGAILRLAMSRGAEAPPIGDPVHPSTVRVLPPIVRPGLIRDFAAFEAHARVVAKHLGSGELPAAWYKTPVGFFSNPHRVLGPDDVVHRPDTEELDYELECAAVIGRDVSNVSVESAPAVIAGYTVFNDWSARDLQRRERALGGGGPSKGKDFANSLGPWLVTPDELGGTEQRPSATMVARVNGVEYSRGDLADMHFSFAELVAYTAKDAILRAGDIIGSGTCGTGCIFELSLTHGSDRYPWLKVGDVVELEVVGIGTLRNIVGPRVP